MEFTNGDRMFCQYCRREIEFRDGMWVARETGTLSCLLDDLVVALPLAGKLHAPDVSHLVEAGDVVQFDPIRQRAYGVAFMVVTDTRGGVLTGYAGPKLFIARPQHVARIGKAKWS